MCSSSSRSRKVKCVMSPSAAKAPVTSLVTTRKRSSLWWRPTTTSFAERSDRSANLLLLKSIRKSWVAAVAHSQSSAAPSNIQIVAESPSQLFLPVVPANQTDKQLQQACDLLLCRPWLEIAMSNSDSRDERRKHVNKPHKHPKPYFMLMDFCYPFCFVFVA